MTSPLTLDASWYSDPDVYGAERDRIFANSWQLVTHLDRLPPSHVLATEVAGWPLLVLRDREGVLRAFHNVCRHRAGPLLYEGECVAADQLQCRYHGWCYALTGQLTKAPRFGADPGAEGLFPVHVAALGSFVFVHLGEPSRSLEGEFPQLQLPPGLDELRLHRVIEHELACNWKTYMENYLEGYHIPSVHPGLDREVEARQYKVEVNERSCTHQVPAKAPGVYTGWFAWLWPNAALNVYEHGLNLERVLPLGPRRTRIEYTFVFDGEVDPDEVISVSSQVTSEDRRIVEAVQRNLEAGIYTRGRLSPRHETGVASFQQQVAAALGSDSMRADGGSRDQ